MQEILDQQKITNSRLLRIENKALEMKNVLVSILDSVVGLAEIIGGISSSSKAISTKQSLNDLSNYSMMSPATVNFSPLMDTSLPIVAKPSVNINEQDVIPALDYKEIKDVTNISEEEREAIKRDEKVIELLTEIRDLLTPKEVQEKKVELKEEPSFLSKLLSPLSMLGGLFGGGGDADIDVDVYGKPSKKKGGKIGKLLKAPITALSKLGPFALGAGAIAGGYEALKDFETGGDWSSMIKSFAGGFVEMLSFGLFNSQEVKDALNSATSSLTNGIELVVNTLGEWWGSIKEFFSADSFLEFLEKMYSGVKGAIGGAIDVAGTQIGTAMDATSQATGTMFDDAIKALGNTFGNLFDGKNESTQIKDVPPVENLLVGGASQDSSFKLLVPKSNSATIAESLSKDSSSVGNTNIVTNAPTSVTNVSQSSSIAHPKPIPTASNPNPPKLGSSPSSN